MKLKNITLEMSLKAFGKTDKTNWPAICEKLFRQWSNLCRYTDQVSVLLWVGDGSEILDYSGNLDENVEWAKYIGGANPHPDKLDSIEGGNSETVHSPNLYCENPGTFTYRSLNEIITIIRSVGKRVLEKPIRIGETFDPGPEFAKSSFKYQRHPESCKDAGFDGGWNIVSCYSVLNGDDRPYAAFPEGIPDKTPFGEFFAKQVKGLFQDIDFDYIWLSNGFGFGNYPWGYEGMIFKDEKYNLDHLEEIQRRNLHFWELFKNICPDIPVEVRGTNISTGIDLATDGVPLKEIYEGGFIDLPAPNSPWAALNKDIGIELAGWMSHIAKLPKDDYLFRFYIHDPWWDFSPWLQNYERLPYDINLPLAVCRVDENGNTQLPGNLSFLSIDNTSGEMPAQVPLEVTPCLVDAFKHGPDAPGPLVWIYPFDEYHNWIKDDKKVKDVFFGDLLIRDSINNGFPMNTVCSTCNFIKNPESVEGRILVSPIPDAESMWEKHLIKHVEKGGDLFLYGSLKHASRLLLDLLGVSLAEEIEGEFSLNIVDKKYSSPSGFSEGLSFKHCSIYAGGGLCEIGGSKPLITAQSISGQRSLAVESETGKGKIVWFRGSAEHHTLDNRWLDDGYICYNDEEGHFSTSKLSASLLQSFAWEFRYHCPSREILEPAITIHQNRNGLIFSGVAKNSLIEYELSTPLGIPVMLNTDFMVKNNRAVYRFPRGWRTECRVFIKQEKDTFIACRKMQGDTKHRLVVSGLINAEVIVLPESGCESKFQAATPGGKVVYDHCPGSFNDLNYLKLKETVSGNLVLRW